MCKQISDFTVKTVLCANGERLPTLLHSNNGMPDFDATLWVVTSLRSQNVASATIEQALRSIKILYLVLQSKKIALSERLREGRILDPAEIELICKAAKQTTSTTASEAIKQEKTEPHRIAKGVVSLEKFRLRMTTRDNNIDVDSGTTAIRMSYIRAFLNWRINREIFRANGEKKTDLLMLRNLVDAEMKSKSPSTPGRATISTRTGIDRQAQTLLLAVVTPDHSQNPWTGEFIKSRNQLIVNLLIALGVRRGELLGMRINDIKPRSQDVEILRRPDDITDPRLNESNTKTRDRVLRPASDAARRRTLAAHRDALGATLRRDRVRERGCPLARLLAPWRTDRRASGATRSRPQRRASAGRSHGRSLSDRRFDRSRCRSCLGPRAIFLPAPADDRTARPAPFVWSHGPRAGGSGRSRDAQ